MLTRTYNHRNYQLLSVAWLAIIVFSSSIPYLSVPEFVPQSDKLAHIVVFAGFSFLLLGSIFQYIKQWTRLTQISLIMTVVIVIGAADELHQAGVVGRTASAWDFLADVIGGYLGMVVFRILHHRK